MFGRVKLWGAAAIAVGVAFIAAYLRGRSDGEANSTAQGYKDTLDKIRTAKEVKHEVEILDDAGLTARAAKWVRDADK